jgi:hypothetical protein
MTSEEHYTLVEIYTGNPWLVRKKLGEFLESVRIEDKPQKVSSIEKWGNSPSTGLVGSHRPIVELNLNGTKKVQYPEYTGAPTV